MISICLHKYVFYNECFIFLANYLKSKAEYCFSDADLFFLEFVFNKALFFFESPSENLVGLGDYDFGLGGNSKFLDSLVFGEIR